MAHLEVEAQRDNSQIVCAKLIYDRIEFDIDFLARFAQIRKIIQTKARIVLTCSVAVLKVYKRLIFRSGGLGLIYILLDFVVDIFFVIERNLKTVLHTD